jgi:hypothetical protein
VTTPIVIRRFGPDPVGFDDDGVILQHGELTMAFHGLTIAASGDELQVNAARYDGIAPGPPALTAGITTAPLIRVPNVAFDAEGLTSSTPPLRSFHAVSTDANPDPIGIAVTR